MVLFNTIALAGGDSSILISRLSLTLKQYYSRVSDLTSAGLITRKNGKYSATSFGKVVCEAQELIGKAVQNLSRLNAIDSIDCAEFPTAERDKIVDSLIKDSKIKEMLVRKQCFDTVLDENENTKTPNMVAPLQH